MPFPGDTKGQYCHQPTRIDKKSHRFGRNMVNLSLRHEFRINLRFHKMITQIGIVAGEIWHYLETRETVEFAELAEGIQQPHDMVLMSVGWLAREGHVVVRNKQGDLQICLRKDQVPSA